MEGEKDAFSKNPGQAALTKVELFDVDARKLYVVLVPDVYGFVPPPEAILAAEWVRVTEPGKASEVFNVKLDEDVRNWREWAERNRFFRQSHQAHVLFATRTEKAKKAFDEMTRALKDMQLKGTSIEFKDVESYTLRDGDSISFTTRWEST